MISQSCPGNNSANLFLSTMFITHVINFMKILWLFVLYQSCQSLYYKNHKSGMNEGQTEGEGDVLVKNMR